MTETAIALIDCNSFYCSCYSKMNKPIHFPYIAWIDIILSVKLRNF